jgi:hypothetical protein
MHWDMILFLMLRIFFMVITQQVAVLHDVTPSANALARAQHALSRYAHSMKKKNNAPAIPMAMAKTTSAQFSDMMTPIKDV